MFFNKMVIKEQSMETKSTKPHTNLITKSVLRLFKND